MFLASLRNFFITFFIALLVFGVCAYYITGFVVDSVQGLMVGDSVTEKTDGEKDSTEDNDPDDYIPTYYDDIEGESFNVLLVGTDYRKSLLTDYAPGTEAEYPFFENSKTLIGDGKKLPEYPYRTVSADAIVLACVNKSTHTVALVNMPSDMVISFSDTTDTTTLGDLYFELGFKEFKNKIADITGVEIDYYAITSIEQIANLVDAVGSVNYDVPRDMEYIDEASGLSISLAKGSQTINGEKAMQLLSFKANGYSRAETMLSFLEVIAKKVSNPSNRLRAAQVFANVSSYVQTDATADDVVGNLDVVLGISSFEFIKYDYPIYRSSKQPNKNKAIDEISRYIEKE